MDIKRKVAQAVTWLENASSSFSERLMARENREALVVGTFFTALLLAYLLFR